MEIFEKSWWEVQLTKTITRILEMLQISCQNVSLYFGNCEKPYLASVHMHNTDLILKKGETRDQRSNSTAVIIK